MHEYPHSKAAITKALRDRFRPYTHDFEIDTKLQRLRMQNGNLEGYVKQFLHLMAQVPLKSDAEFLHCFARGVTAEFREEIFVKGVTKVTEAIELCRRIALARKAVDT